MTSPIIAADRAFRAMVAAFNTANEEQQQVHNAIDAAEGQLGSQWGGDASRVYHQALEAWMQGFGHVRQAMKMQNDAMVEYAGTTTSVEDDALVNANFTP